MKRFFSILLIAALLVGVTPLMASVALAEDYATVTSDNGYGVRLREGPSKAYRVIAKYDVGTTVVVQQQGIEWSQLRVGSTVGWMMNRYLRFGAVGNVGSTGGTVSGIGTATVTSGNGLRVWLRATEGGKRLQLYRPGTQVTVLSHGSKWCHISIDGVMGYMMTEFLDFGSAPATASGKITDVGFNYPLPVTPAVGDVLQATVKPEGATVKYSWKVAGVEQSNTASLNVLRSYVGEPITLTVTGIGASTGTLTKSTEPVVANRWVTAVKLNKEQPFVGDTLSALLTPSAADVAYSWRVGGSEVGTDETYTVQPNDLGKLIQLKVTGQNGWGGVAVCTAGGNVLSNMTLHSVKLNKEQPIVGDVLSATVEPSGANAKYTWTANGEQVGNTASYKVGPNDLGKVIALKVEGVAPYTGSVNAETSRVKGASLASVSINAPSLVVGEMIYAVPSPADATATYTWMLDGEELKNASGKGLELADGYVDKKISVKAVGSGVYTGEATSGEVGPVVSDTRVTGVKLDNTAPVVGDKLTVVLTPKNLNDVKTELSYVWTIGTETVTDTTGTYKVLAADVGKTIRVRAVGGVGYTGEATSAFTSPVVGSAKVTGVSITNDTTKANASATSPEVGHTLKANVSPAQATVTYEWKRGNTVVAGDVNTYTLTKDDKDQQITVTVKGKDYYSDTKSATTAKVVQYKTITGDLYVGEVDAGKTPLKSTSLTIQEGKNKITMNASIQWLEGDLPAEFDQYGHFKPGAAYTAKVTITPASGYSMNGASIKLNGNTAKVEGNTASYEFSTAPSVIVTDYYISGIPVPVPGAAVEEINFDTPQYNVSVEWDSDNVENGRFANLTEYTATITLTLDPDKGYTLTGVPANVFTVGGASSTTYTAGGNEVIAKYNIKRTVTVTADRTVVELNGVNRPIVQCSASMDNYTGMLKDVKWYVDYATTDGTRMTPDGTLVIGATETVDKNLVARAVVTLADGSEYTGTLAISLISGTGEGDVVNVVFVKNPTTVERGSKVLFDARVSNSMMGVDWSCFTATESETKIDKNGVLYVDEYEMASYVKITATSIDDPSKSASVTAQIVDPPELPSSLSLMTLQLDADTLVDATAAAPDASLAVAPDANGITDSIADLEADAKNEATDAKDEAAEPDASTETEEKTEDDKQTVATIPTDGDVSITIVETKPEEETGTPDGAPAADGAQDEEPAADGAQSEEPAADGAQVEEPAADGAQDEEPAADGAQDEEPAADGAQDEEPAADGAQDEEPAAAGAQDEEPVADGAQDEEPAADGVQDEEPAADGALDEEPAADGVQDEEPAADGAQDEQPAAADGAQDEESAAAGTQDEQPEEEEVTSGIVIKNEDGTVVDQRELDEKPEDVEKADDAKEGQTAEEGKQDAKAESGKKSTSANKSEDESEPEEELDDESFAELDKQENSIVIKFTKAADKIARGNYSQFSIEVSGADKADAVWSIVKRKGDLKPISTVCSQDGKVTVGADEQATSFYVKVTVGGTSKYRKVFVVDPEKKDAVNTETQAPATTTPATTTPTTDAPVVNNPDTSSTQPAAGLTEEEMGNQAMQEENYEVDPVLSSF